MNIRAKKSLGQNWLVNPHILDKIADSAGLTKEDTVVEVGPGTGNLTKLLAQKAGRVIAIEKDHRLIPQLSQLASQYKNINVIEDDILEFNPESYKLQDMRYKVVGNIPYYITSNFLRTIFEDDGWRMARPKLIVLTIQKEVAQRIIAKPPHMNLLALSVQYYSDPEIVGIISKNNFRPIPKIDSAIIKLGPKSQIINPKRDKELFELMRMGFSEKRKQLAGLLAKNLQTDKEKILKQLTASGIPGNARAENLPLNKWADLARTLFPESD